MINVSSAFLEQIKTRTDFAQHAEITFADGRSLNLTGDDFTLDNNSITDGAGESSVPLGFAVEKTVKLELTNYDDRYRDYDFFGAVIHLYVVYTLDSGLEDTINYGYYTVVSPESYGETVIVTAADDMYKADKPFSTGLSFAAGVTAMQLLVDVCNTTGIVLGSGSFPNSSFVIPALPEGSYSFRQIIGYIAMIACGNARIGYDGMLYIISYQLSPTPLYTLDQWISRPRIHTDDITITGIRTEVKVDGVDRELINGTDAYAITVDNPFCTTQAKAQELIDNLAVNLVGKTFRAFEGEYIGYPVAEFMDPISFVDGKGVTHTSFLTDITYKFRGKTEFKCAADEPLRHSVSYSTGSSTYIRARKLVEAERSARERAIEVLARQIEGSSGLYTSTEIQPDGSTIYYLHNKPRLEESRYIWKMTAEAWAVSSDGGETWNAGMEVNGNVIANILSANGINADWIDTGSLIVRDQNGKIIFSASVSGHSVYISGDNVQIGGEPLSSALETIDGSAESRARTWYQPSTQDPALEWNNLYDHNGDPILDHDGLPFELVSDPGKNGHIGDIWHQTDTGTLWLYTESGWVTNAYTTNDDLDAYYNNITQQEIFDKLTNNRQDTGIFLLNGQLYINANYLNVGDGANLYSNYDTMSQITDEKDAISWRHNCNTSGNISNFKLGISDRINGNYLRIQNNASVTSSGGYVFLGNAENHYGLIPVRTGQKYRISFFARSSVNGRIKLWLVKTNTWTSQPANTDCYGKDTYSADLVWKRYGFNYDNSNTDDNTACSYLGLGFANLANGAIADICGIMIEQVDSVDQATSPFAPAGTTQIDGGNIKAESIDASSIKSKSITSDQIDVVGGWKINANSIESNGTWSEYSEEQQKDIYHPNIELLKDGKIKIGNVLLYNSAKTLHVEYGLVVHVQHESISAGDEEFKIIGLTAQSGTPLNIYDNIVGMQQASSKRYKDPCGLATLDDVRKLLDLPVVWFKYKDGYLKEGDRFEGKPMIGLYAEDVYEAIPEAAQINADGQIEDWNHRILLPAMLKLIQDQNSRIQSLEDRVSKLEKLLTGGE